MNGAEEHLYAVIMAGGAATGLWPLSRRKSPGQFLPVRDDRSMFSVTLERIEQCIPKERIFVVTSSEGAELVSFLEPGFHSGNVLVEPQSRGTAPCAAFAAAVLRKRDPHAVICLLPVDHHVADDALYARTLLHAADIAVAHACLVSIGICPDYPETRYGYMQVGQEAGLSCSRQTEGKLYTVKTIAGKPDRSTADTFIQSGDFYWNSGIFVATMDTLCSELRSSEPELYRDMLYMSDAVDTPGARNVIEDVYSWLHPASLDEGLLARSTSAVMLEGLFGWRDLCCWDDIALTDGGEDDWLSGRKPQGVVEIDSRRNLVKTPPGKTVSLVGVTDLIVIDTGDALLVCRRGDSAGVCAAVDVIRREGREESL
ncbi:mannose-1-phosphate guanylyltransferase [Prosthecochloris sp. CIB 2401]|uniref:mannose-1-phosphate guanylyltransferase n=1 Tax=Prosthecochloris sp. CIB 2401 TaxID=1868325 RepID=UPI00080AB92D|nr:sugar phosphate nucleotidyltransferase [Prosthecochloris sp. CIB 2401]ANT65817.1 Mannose-1-phosphate guanylyltransferase RfbM [Prosthecochloris sp. CIB 2401]